MKGYRKISFFILAVALIFTLTLGVTFAVNGNESAQISEKKISTQENDQQLEINKNNLTPTNKKTSTKTQTTNDIKKNSAAAKKQQTKKSDATDQTDNTLVLKTRIKKVMANLVYDTGNETAITKSIAVVNGRPDVKKLGNSYAYANEEGVYNITSDEILRVRQLDSYCQQIYGFTPKYTFFRAENSNTKYIISREKWNVISRALSKYHVDMGYNAVNPPYKLTVNLSGKVRYTPIYFDAQELINGEYFTCGPTSMSMISQALNVYSSEKKLSGIYYTTQAWGTDESSIIRYSPSVKMKLTDISDTKASVKKALLAGKMIFWHIRGHYMAIVAYNAVNDRFLCLNPSGPSHNIDAVQWATWTQVRGTDRGLKENGFMAVTPYWSLSKTDMIHAKYYYHNMGGKYTAPANSQYANTADNPTTITVEEQSHPTKVNKTILIIKASLKNSNNQITNGRVSFSLNGKVIGTPLIKNGVAFLKCFVPAYITDYMTLCAKYVDTHKSMSSKRVSLTFSKNVLGQTYRNSAKIGSLESFSVTKIRAKKGDNVTLKAYLQDKYANPVNGGQVIFKINGKTITKTGRAVKIKLTNGTASFNYTIPGWSAKKYTITAVFIKNNYRKEAKSTLTIAKLATKLVNLTKTKTGNKLRIKAKIVDERGDLITKTRKVTIKINSKTVMSNARIYNGKLDKVLDISKYRKGKYKITIIVGGTAIYKSKTVNFKIVKA